MCTYGCLDKKKKKVQDKSYTIFSEPRLEEKEEEEECSKTPPIVT